MTAVTAAIQMRPMRPDEFGAWRERFLRDWSEDLVRVEDLAPADAPREAGRRLAGDLPDGMATVGQHLFVLIKGDVIVGHLWFSTGDRGAFLEDVTITTYSAQATDRVTPQPPAAAFDTSHLGQVCSSAKLVRV